MTYRSALLFILPMALFVSCETTQPEKRYFISSYYGMKDKPHGLGNTALVKEGDPERLKRYKRVIIEDVKVIPSKSNDPKIKAVTREESERLAEKFEDILEEELGKKYEITRYRSYNTLTVRAALTELKPSNPALFAVNYLPYAGAAAGAAALMSGETLGAGSTTVEAEVLDSRSRRQLYAMVDQLKGTRLHVGGLEKWGQSEGAMRMWSRQISRGIQATTATKSENHAASKPKPAPKPKTSSSTKEKKDPKPLFGKPADDKSKTKSSTTKKKPTSTKSASKKDQDKKPFWGKKEEA